MEREQGLPIVIQVLGHLCNLQTVFNCRESWKLAGSLFICLRWGRARQLHGQCWRLQVKPFNVATFEQLTRTHLQVSSLEHNMWNSLRQRGKNRQIIPLLKFMLFPYSCMRNLKTDQTMEDRGSHKTFINLQGICHPWTWDSNLHFSVDPY